jgi:FKBP-type peptidyl-prolyl cis-trans isomerase 2
MHTTWLKRYKMPAKKGDMVTVHYTGKTEDGNVFDILRSKTSGTPETAFPCGSENKEPLQFMIGAGQMLTGFENGIIGMEEGAKKEIIIPAGEGYNKGELAGKKLIFTVRLVKIGLSKSHPLLSGLLSKPPFK